MSDFKKAVHGEEFLNVILGRLWPFLEKFLNKDEIKNEVYKAAKGYIALKSIKLGSPMKLHEASIPKQPWLMKNDQDPLIFDAETEFKNVEVSLSETTLGLSFGVIASFKCKLRIELQKLTADFLPLFEAVTFYFTEKPKMDLDFTNAANMLDLANPEHMIGGLLEVLLLYPNRRTIPMKEHVDISRLLSPLPIGLLVMQVAKIENLHDTHEYWANGIKSEPEFYYQVHSHFGDFTSKTRNAEDVDGDTSWNEVVAVVVCEPELESLEIKVYEDDYAGDDFVGKVHFKNLSDLIFPSVAERDATSKKESEAKEFQKVFDLIGDKTGKATILFEFHPLCTNVTGYCRKTFPDEDKLDDLDAKPLNLQNNNKSKAADLRYYLKVYITKISRNEKSSSEKASTEKKAAGANDKDPMASKTFHFECIENEFPQESKVYGTGDDAIIPTPMVTEVFLKDMPSKLNFVLTTDRKALKQAAFAEFEIDLKDNESLPSLFEDEMQFQVDVKDIGCFNVVIHCGRLSKQ